MLLLAKLTRCSRLVLVLSSGLALATVVARAQPTISVRFKISAPAEMPLGTPLVLQTKLVNLGPAPVTLIPLLDPAYGFASYRISGPRGVTWFHPYFSFEIGEKALTLDSGATQPDNVPLFCGVEGYTYPDSGESYKIQGFFHGLRGALANTEVPSNEVTVAVTKGQGDGGYGAIMALPDVCRFISVRGAQTLSNAATKLEVVGREEGGDLSRYANTSLGEFFLRGSPALPGTDAQQPEFERALQYLQLADNGVGSLSSYFQTRLYGSLFQATAATDPLRAEEYFHRLTLDPKLKEDPHAILLIEREHRQLQNLVGDRSIALDTAALVTHLRAAGCLAGGIKVTPGKVLVHGAKARLEGDDVARAVKISDRIGEWQVRLAGNRAVATAPLVLDSPGIKAITSFVEIETAAVSYPMTGLVSLDASRLPGGLRFAQDQIKVTGLSVKVPCFAERPSLEGLRFELAPDTVIPPLAPGQMRLLDLMLKHPADWTVSPGETRAKVKVQWQ